MPATSAETRPHARRLPDGRTALDLFCDHARGYPRLSAEQERAALRNLVDLRRDSWTTLLAQPTVAERLAPRLRELAQSRDTTVDDPTFIDVLATHGGELLQDVVAELQTEQGRAWLPDTAATASYLDTVRRQAEAYRNARNHFLCANLRLVVTIAGRFGNQWMSLADRVQEGNLGLVKAVERFDPERGTRFSTYAVWWIRHHITQALVNRGRKIRIPANLHRLFMKARKAIPQLSAELGREPTDAEVAERIGTTIDKLVDARRAMQLRAVGLDQPAGDSEERTVAEVLAVPDDVDLDGAMDDERHVSLALSAFEELDDKAQDILRHRFGLDGHDKWTLRKLGERYDVSRERIRQLQNRALRRLRAAVESGTAAHAAA